MVLREAVYEFEQTFVTIGFLTVIAGLVLGIRVFGPRGRQVAAWHDASDETRAGAAHQKLMMFGVIDTAIVVITILVMVDRTGLS
jgi:hypothetical protein